ncbi:MAG TPA: hypothetical protein VI757_16355 [Bacteroidia bacterium]|nr:hypothetical protein [Bacteroidia bacterium]
MFRQYAFLLGLIIISAFASNAQKVIWSLPLSESSKLIYPKVTGQNEDGFYFVRSNHPVENENEIYSYRNNRFLVSFYDYDMRLLWEKAVVAGKKDTRIICFVSVDNYLKEISSEWNKAEKKFRLLTRSFDKAGTADTSYNTVAEEEINSVDNETSCFITASQGRNYFLIAYQTQSESNEQRYAVLLCDSSLHVLKKNMLHIPLSRKYFNPHQFKVSNSGDIFLFGVKTDSQKRSRDVDRNFFTLFCKPAINDSWNEYEIRGIEHFLTDAGVAVDELNHKLVVTGFYSDKTEYSIAGVFYYHLDLLSPAKNEIRFSSFAPSFLYKFLREQKENYNRELVNYSIDKIILRRDGGAVIVAESNYTSDYSYYDYYLRTYISRKYYHRDNIIQLSVNKDGTLLWSNVIQKEQTSDDDDNIFFSYTSAIAGGKIHCIYNRFLKRRTQVLQNNTDILGSEKSSALFSEEQDVYIMPSASKQVNENMLVIPAYKGKELRLAGIIF